VERSKELTLRPQGPTVSLAPDLIATALRGCFFLRRRKSVFDLSSVFYGEDLQAGLQDGVIRQIGAY
jgi:hypothetical protein